MMTAFSSRQERAESLLKELQIAGGKRLTAAEFLRGHPIAPGVHLGKTE